MVALRALLSQTICQRQLSGTICQRQIWSQAEDNDKYNFNGVIINKEVVKSLVQKEIDYILNCEIDFEKQIEINDDAVSSKVYVYGYEPMQEETFYDDNVVVCHEH